MRPRILYWLAAVFIYVAGFGPYSLAQVIPPYTTGFETGNSIVLGDLNSQDGWQVTQGTASVVNTTASTGLASVELEPNSTPVLVAHVFGAEAGATITYVDFFSRPSISENTGQSTAIDAEGSGIELIRLDATGHVLVFDGDGNNGGHWISLVPAIELDSDGQAVNWVRFTLRQNYTTKKWDFYLDGHMVARDLGFKDNTKTYFSLFHLTGGATASSYFDDFYVGSINPLFIDNDNDGMEDSWETAHGLASVLLHK